MNLTTVEIEGFRRLEKHVSIDVSGPVVCLVGPNEAGKSSILDAMLTLNDDQPISESDKTKSSTASVLVSASYVIEKSDRDAFEYIRAPDQLRWWTVTKKANGRMKYDLHPPIKDDLSWRRSMAACIEKLIFRGELKRLVPSTDHPSQDLSRQAVEALRADTFNLANDQITAIREFGNALYSAVETHQSDPEEELAETIDVSRHLATFEEGPSDTDYALMDLRPRRPKFILFSDEDRDLRSTYQLTDPVIGNPPPALKNLAGLADLDLARLVSFIKSGNGPERTRLIEEANANLEAAMRGSWNQSRIDVRLYADGNVLEVAIRSQPGNVFSNLEERSSGLRWFVALRAFLQASTKQSDIKPIVLVDEAETHLHYDAQADVVRMFEAQTLAQKVIYTTHSAGCLPQDLGTSIRVVTPIGDTHRSTVRNSVWFDHEPGFTPLVFAMGATALSFLPARYVLLVEGITDAMLFPTLFREAVGQEKLEFQVAPGLSFAGNARLKDLPSQGGAVAYLVDGDGGGEKLRAQLRDSGVSDSCLLSLVDYFPCPVTVEDLIEPKLFDSIVNSIVGDFTAKDSVFSLDPQDVTGRATRLKEWCKDHEVSVDKVDIAQRLLDARAEAVREGKDLKLSWSRRRPKLKKIHDDILGILQP